MVFYLIGLGLNLRSLSIEALEICRKADKIYLEAYTVEFPYKIEELEKIIGKRIILLTRLLVENEKFLDEAKRRDIVLLTYGSPLVATTHISLVLKCKEKNINCRVFHNAGIFDAVAEIGLQIYKFGKTASIPKWQEDYKPDSFVNLIQENRKIKAHTLILADIGLAFSDALKQLEEACEGRIELEKIIVCSRLGTEKGEFFYDSIEELYGKEIYPPFCFVIPAGLHFLEKEALEKLGN